MRNLVLIPALLLLPVVGAQAEMVIDATCRIDYEVTEDVRIVDGADPPTIVGIEESASLSDVLVLGSSVVNIAGGQVGNVESHDSSTIKVSGGSGGPLRAYDTSALDLPDGSHQNLDAYDSSTVNLAGGEYEWVSANGCSTMNVEGASGECLYSNDSSTVDFSGGFYELVFANDSSIMNIDGGGWDEVYARGSSAVTISAGSDQPGNIYADHVAGDPSPCVVTIRGSGFNYPYGEIPDATGNLTGVLADGSQVEYRFHITGDASILLVPEPSVLIGLLGMGGIGLAVSRRRRGRWGLTR